MATVRWHVTMSLDGYIAAAGDDMGWVFRYPDPNPEADEVATATGAILAGRRSYEVGTRPDQHPEAGEPFGGGWRGAMFVLTHHPPAPEDDPSVRFVAAPVEEAVETALSAANGKDVLVIGANLAAQCLDAGLIDELRVHVAPVLLGAGVRLLDRPGAPVDLERVAVGSAGPVTNLRFRLPRGAGSRPRD